jgi:hypothetical protein
MSTKIDPLSNASISGIGILIHIWRQDRKRKMEEALSKVVPPTPPTSRAVTPAISDFSSDKSSWIEISEKIIE